MASSKYIGCVYLATNRINDKSYIGKSLAGMPARQKTHYSHAINGGKQPFSCAIRKYGFESFDWSELFRSGDNAALLDAEMSLIAAYRQAGHALYNVTPGGDGGRGKWTDAQRVMEGGRVVPTAVRDKIRASWTPERRAAQAEKMRTRVVSESTRQKAADCRIGKKLKPETIEKIRQCKIGKKMAPRENTHTAKFLKAKRKAERLST